MANIEKALRDNHYYMQTYYKNCKTCDHVRGNDGLLWCGLVGDKFLQQPQVAPSGICDRYTDEGK